MPLGLLAEGDITLLPGSRKSSISLPSLLCNFHSLSDQLSGPSNVSKNRYVKRGELHLSSYMKISTADAL